MALGGLVLLYGPYRYFTVKRLMDAGYFRPNFWVRIFAVGSHIDRTALVHTRHLSLDLRQLHSAAILTSDYAGHHIPGVTHRRVDDYHSCAQPRPHEHPCRRLRLGDHLQLLPLTVSQQRNSTQYKLFIRSRAP